MTKSDTASTSGGNKRFCLLPGQCPAILVLLISLMLTGAAWHYVERNDVRARQAIFDRETQEAFDTVLGRAEKFKSVLNGARGFYAASHSVEIEEFHAYVESLNLPQDYPSIRGLAYILRVVPPERASRGTATKSRNRADEVGTAAAEHFSMVYLEPPDAWDSGLLGFDLSSDSVQRAAMEQARDSSASMALGHLPEGSLKKDLFVYRAVYKNGMPATTRAERETAIEGFIVAKVSGDFLCREIFKKEFDNLIDCEAYIGVEDREENRLFCYSGAFAAIQDSSVFKKTYVLETEGAFWTVRFRSCPEFLMQTQRTDSKVVLVLGMVISFLLFGNAWMMASGQSRAITLAGKMTIDFSKSEERCRTLIENVPGVIYRRANDPQWTMEFISDNIESISGYPASDFLGNKVRSYASIIHPEDSKLVDKVVQDGISIREPFIIEHRIITSKGTVKWVYQKGQGIFGVGPGPGPGGDLLHIDGAIFDVTARKQLEEQLYQSQKMESVGQLAGGVAHDFNNILMVMHFHAQRIHDYLPADHPMVPIVDVIQKSARRATELTQQLLAFSRRQIMHIVSLNINNVVANTLRMLRPLLGTNIRIVSNLDPDLAPVHADYGLIGQVIVNLAVNARDAMPQGGTLTLTTSDASVSTALNYHNGDVIPPGDYVVLSIGDSGGGISTTHLSHVFEPFFTTKPIGKGTGLGLAVVYGIVKQHEGGIILETSPQGTTFRIYLPVLKKPHEPVQEISESSLSARMAQQSALLAAASTEGVTILLVEDDEAVRGIGQEILQEAGYTVLTAEDGGAALKLCEEHSGPIHLLFTDVMMPEISGGDLAKRLVRLRPEMKVLYTSGYADDITVRHGISRTSMDFIPKPFSKKDLLWKIREVIAAG